MEDGPKEQVHQQQLRDGAIQVGGSPEVIMMGDLEKVYLSSTLEQKQQLTLKRQLYTQSHLDNVYKRQTPPQTLCDVIKSTCRVSPPCVRQSALRYVPFVTTLWKYNWRQWVLADIISGLSAGFMHLPQGLGYGILASLNPVNGLYTSFFAIIIYLIFGTSPHVSMGTNAVISLLTSALVEGEANSFQASLGTNHTNSTLSPEERMEYKVSIASAASFIGGLILLGMGILRLGFLTNFLSKSFIGGFTFSAAVHIATSQVVKMLNLKLKTRSGMGKLIMTYIDIFTNIRDTNPADVIVGLICMAVLLAVRLGINERYKHKMKIPVPIELIVVIISTIISHFAKLHDHFDIAVVGDIPVGIPSPTLPRMESLSRVAINAFISAILTFALTISLAKLTAKVHDITIDDSQELVAYGLCQLFGAFFKCYSACTAPPRTMMLSSLGAKSTLNGVMSALFLLLVLLVLGQLFVSLPIAMLAAMIIVAMKDLLLQIRNLKSLWYINKNDCCIWALTAAVSVFGDLDIGLLVGVIFSMVTVLAVSQLAKGKLLGKADHEDVIEDLDRKGISSIPGVKIFRFESTLYYASQERFKQQLYSQVMDPTTSPHKDVVIKTVPEQANTSESSDDAVVANGSEAVRKEGQSTLRHLILDCSAMNYIDVSGLDMLELVIIKFGRVGVDVWLANVPSRTISTLIRAGFGQNIGLDKVFYTVVDALENVRQPETIVVKF